MNTDELEAERAKVVELLADALGLSRPLHDLLQKEHVLRFLVEELIASRAGILAAYVQDHGGAPEQGPVGARWELTWQFSSDVWSFYAPEHRLNLTIGCRDLAAVEAFVGELRAWADFNARLVEKYKRIDSGHV